MATPRTGRPRGRPANSKNKLTLERERRALEALQQRSKVPLRKLAKDELAELVPVVKGIVAQFQRAAMVDAEGSGAPGRPNHKPEAWRELREWLRVYGWVADLAADFESPRYRAIAVVAPSPVDSKPSQIIDHESGDVEDRERTANQAYLRLVKG